MTVNNLPVPVLADSEMSASSSKHEARESTDINEGKESQLSRRAKLTGIP